MIGCASAQARELCGSKTAHPPRTFLRNAGAAWIDMR
jgi:hypothetical protein